MEFNFEYAHTLGPIRAAITPNGIAAIILPASDQYAPPLRTQDLPLARKLADAFDRYFSGHVEHFNNLPLDLAAATAFRRAVWQAARAIPWGATTTYGQLAGLIGSRCPRAVGQALGANPVPIIVPCHRILAAGGGLGGFSCGLQWKRALLRLEKIPFAD